MTLHPRMLSSSEVILYITLRHLWCLHSQGSVSCPCILGADRRISISLNPPNPAILNFTLNMEATCSSETSVTTYWRHNFLTQIIAVSKCNFSYNWLQNLQVQFSRQRNCEANLPVVGLPDMTGGSSDIPAWVHACGEETHCTVSNRLEVWCTIHHE
jgi:hypothetical protein